MGNVGGVELLFIAVFALIIFGPKRLPDLARQAGKAMREFRNAAREMTDELKAGLEEEPEAPPSKPRKPGPRV